MVVAPNPTGAGAVAATRERAQQRQRDQFTGVQAGVRMFRNVTQYGINTTKQSDDTIVGGDTVLLGAEA